MRFSGWWSAHALLWVGLLLARESSASGAICVKWTKIQVFNDSAGHPLFSVSFGSEYDGQRIEGPPTQWPSTGKGFHTSYLGEAYLGEEWCIDSALRPNVKAIEGSVNAADINITDLPSASELANLNCGMKELMVWRFGESPELRLNQKFDECEGNCSEDMDCAGSLQCFQGEHRGGESGSVPGCNGVRPQNVGFCIKPTFSPKPKDTKTIGSKSSFKPKKGSLGECEGDCDSSIDCEGTLRCWKRSALENNLLIPGCDGEGKSTSDYCYNPKNDPKTMLEILAQCKAQKHNSKYHNGCKAYANGWEQKITNDCDQCSNTGRAYKSKDIDECSHLCEDLYSTASHYMSLPLCKRGCWWFHTQVTDTGFFNEKNKKGCQAVKYYGNSGNFDNANYYVEMYTTCDDGYYEKNCVQCNCPSNFCDSGIDGAGCANRPFFTFLGSDLTGLGLCEGDCNSDSDCIGELKCGQRENWESYGGCDQRGNEGVNDYCYDASL